MIVAVTGGTGFIGKKLVERLVERGDTVRLLTRNRRVSHIFPKDAVEVCECDLLTIESKPLAAMLQDVEVIYHCAGQLTDLNTMRTLHVESTKKLLKAAAGRVNHWVQLSSVGVYGPVHEGTVDEHVPLNPLGEYEITKAESDQLVIEAAGHGGFSYSILRPSNVFGANMTNQSLFRMISMIDKGLFFFIGKPGASANYIHVDNVVESLVKCGTMAKAKGGVFNLSDHRTLENFVGVIAEELGKPSSRLIIPQPIAWFMAATLGKFPGFPLTLSRVEALTNRSVYSTEHIQQTLGYQHVKTMEEGLRELVGKFQR
ncbi:MAG: NAD-dependent epimerase/dehydratase family protein [Gallionella sp.]